MELVSIITPSYNSSNFISLTINSIIKQSYENWELLITDDFSTDNTIDIIKKFKAEDSRIKLFQLSKNSGAGFARNISIKNSKGRYIAFCDSDDLWKENKLEKQLDFMSKHNLAFTYSNYELINDLGEKIGDVRSPSIISHKDLLKNCYIGCLTVIYDVKKIEKKYFPLLRKRQDWALWIDILSNIKNTKGLDENLASYRIRQNSISSNKIKLIKYNWLVYHEFLKYGKIKSSLLMFRFLIYYFMFKIFKYY